MQERPSAEIFLVDDDPIMRDLLSVVLGQAGYRVTCFAEGDSFIGVARERTPCCVLLDIHLPGTSGLDILTQVNAHRYGAPTVILSAQGDIPVVVDAIKRGAYDFVEKPFELEYLVARVRAAIAGWGRATVHESEFWQRRFPGHDLLTPRELEVLSKIASGDSNKEAARQLGISPRTVEVHRSRIMEKLHARNTADLMRVVFNWVIAEREYRDDAGRTHVTSAGTG